MNRFIATAAALVLLAGAPAIQAAQRDHNLPVAGHFPRHYDTAHSRRGHQPPHGFRQGYAAHRYSGYRGRPHLPYGDHYDRRHGQRAYRRHHDNNGAYLVGGLVVGSLLTHALNRPRDSYLETYDRTIIVSSPATVYRSRIEPRSEQAVSRRLFRDRNGDCFERTRNEQGEELLIELSAEECAW